MATQVAGEMSAHPSNKVSVPCRVLTSLTMCAIFFFFLNSINDVQGTKHTKQFGSICGWPYCIVKCRQCFSDMVVDLTPHNFSAYFGILVSSPQAKC